MWKFGNESGWINFAYAVSVAFDHSRGSGGIAPSWSIRVYFPTATGTRVVQFSRFDREDDATAAMDELVEFLTAERSGGYVIDVSPKPEGT